MKKCKFLAAFIAFIFSACIFGANICAVGGSDSGRDPGMMFVIRDADGNIVETYAQSRMIWVDGVQFTIPANGTLSTMRYDVSLGFSAGFYFTHTSYSGFATTPDRAVEIAIYNSSSVESARNYVISKAYSTNLGANPNCYSLPNGYCAILSPSSVSSSRPYYEIVYTNLSSSSMTISLYIAKD